MRIIADCMGSDLGAVELLKGCVAAVKECGVDIVAVGKREELLKIISENSLSTEHIEIVDAESVMDMHDTPTAVLKEKSDSSMGVALRLLRDGKGDAMVSAGNTGALLAGGTLIVKRIKGIKRAALAPIFPCKGGFVMIIDSGANTECRPEYLDQFGLMGSIYMKNAEGIDNPRVGLANNGAEETKGTQLCLDSYELLKNNKYINFVGNVEGRGLMLGECEVFVCDGFTGNLVLKTCEGMGKFMMELIKELFMSSIISKIAALLVKGNLGKLKKSVDYKEVGGAVLLGISKPVIKAHGSSDARAFKNAIRQAVRFANGDVISRIADSLEKQREEQAALEAEENKETN